ncbi:phosphate ABC transporter substrate-binding protein, PhoT family [Longilinea arvoryzae]|uniref:Phosphate-binding protein n=1 Tax=Longilinea arvoryzae TaxID=360412 RepID=A0A0S7BCQ4_9CHLR|nr:PstS family phosphate ABC transporter substrate-binding protein [Longilinea arvoryzae]GAP15470.1 phosphate ABC transporter substrate-binding protein, PhoT family [Longilinea arvoryzae]
MKWRITPLLICLSLFLTGCSTHSNSSDSQQNSTIYLQNKGSDTIVNLALAWAERYQTIRPEVSISVTGGGSGTGITSLINGTVDIANASRQITQEEIAAAQANGIDPVEHVIARDAIAVIVNPENPVSQLTMEQISRIYRGEIANWKEVGGEDRPIVRLSRETNSGTHVYFLEAVVRLGNKNDKAIFSPLTLLLPSSEGIISEVRDNPNAIGYDGLGYVTPEVKVIAVSPGNDKAYVLPSIESVNNQSYPIARDLYMYSKKDDPQAVVDYMQWILSPEAQQIVIDLGFVPIKTTP